MDVKFELSKDFHMKQKLQNYDYTAKIFSFCQKEYLITVGEKISISEFSVGNKTFGRKKEHLSPGNPAVTLFYTDEAFCIHYAYPDATFKIAEVVKLEDYTYCAKEMESTYMNPIDNSIVNFKWISQQKKKERYTVFYFDGKIMALEYTNSFWLLSTFDPINKEFRLSTLPFCRNECDSFELFTIHSEVFVWMHSKSASRSGSINKICKEGKYLVMKKLCSTNFLEAEQTSVFHLGCFVFIFGYGKNGDCYILTFDLRNNTFSDVMHCGKTDRYYNHIEIYKHNGQYFLYGVQDREFFMIELFSALNYKLSSWMKDLKPLIGHIDLRELKIPATHNSGAFGPYEPLAGRVCCQSYNIGQQLELGVRCFDLRLMFGVLGEGKVFMHHNGVYAATQDFCEALNQIENFLKQNKEEFVVLTFSKFQNADPYFFEYVDNLIHVALYEHVIIKTEENKALMQQRKLPFKSIVRRHTNSTNQVFLYYRTSDLSQLDAVNPMYYWSGDCFQPTYKPDINSFLSPHLKEKTKIFEKYFENVIKNREKASVKLHHLDFYMFHTFYAIPTMARYAQFIYRDLLASLPNEEQKNINLVAFDFVTDQTSKDIIELNLMQL